MPTRSLTDTAFDCIHDLWKRRAFTQQQLADALGKNLSAVNRIIHGQQKLTLDVIEAVAKLVGVAPVELLADPSTELKALNPLEATLLRHFRSWPQPTREAFIEFSSFFADEEPVTYAQRVAHEQLRRLKPEAVRQRAYAYLTFLSEGGLTPDLQEAFGLLDSDGPPETPSSRGTPTKKRRRA